MCADNFIVVSFLECKLNAFASSGNAATFFRLIWIRCCDSTIRLVSYEQSCIRLLYACSNRHFLINSHLTFSEIHNEQQFAVNAKNRIDEFCSLCIEQRDREQNALDQMALSVDFQENLKLFWEFNDFIVWELSFFFAYEMACGLPHPILSFCYFSFVLLEYLMALYGKWSTNYA